MSARRQWLRAAGASGLGLFLPACGRDAPPHTAPAPPPGPTAPAALRLDVRHEMADGAERFVLTRVRAVPHWRGRRSGPDRLGWGDYRLSVYEPSDGTLLFQQGFDSNLERAARASTQISVRIPLPRRAVQVIVEKRRAGDTYTDAWNTRIDPSSVEEPPPGAPAPRLETLSASRAAGAGIGLAILGDGYAGDEYDKFVADAKRAAAYLFSIEPLKTRAADFDVRSVFVPSTDSGVTDAYLGTRKRTAFDCRYAGGEQERTLFVGDEAALRDAAGAVPYDFLLVLANARRYGGSAYFGGPAVVAIDSAAARYLVIHELAHVIGGLAEEYYLPARDGAPYRGNVEPWHPNVTTSAARAAAKWSAFTDAPALVPWNKAEYDRRFAQYLRRYFALRAAHADEAEIEKLMQAERVAQTALLAKNEPLRRVGLFEGANGYGRGMFRAEAGCVMFSLQTEYFCAACASAIRRMIDERLRA